MGDAALTAAQPFLSGPGISRYLLVGIWLLGVVDLFYPRAERRQAGVIALALFIGLTLFRASRHLRVLCIALAAVAVSIAAAFGNWEAIPPGLESALIFGAFLPTVLLMRATAEESSRTISIREKFAGMDKGRRVGSVLLSSHVMGSVLNVGAMAILSPMIPNDASPGMRKAIAESSVRGVSSAVMWSPFFVAMGVASQLVPTVHLWQIMPVGLSIAFLGLVIAHVMFSRGVGLGALGDMLASVRPLVKPVLITVVLVLLLTAFTRLRGLQAIVLIVPPLCLAFLATLGQGRVKKVAARTFASLGRLTDEIIIVASGMVLGAVVGSAPGLGEALGHFNVIAWSPAAIIGGGVALMVAGGFCGLHPMISATVMLPLLRSVPLGISDVVLMETVVFGWGLSATVSIWALPVVAAAALFKVPVRHLALGRNLVYVAVYGLAAVAALTGFNYVLVS